MVSLSCLNISALTYYSIDFDMIFFSKIKFEISDIISKYSYLEKKIEKFSDNLIAPAN